jgi:hypothetical protein
VSSKTRLVTLGQLARPIALRCARDTIDGETHVHHAIADAGRLTSVKSLHANVMEVPGCRRARAGDEAAYGACRADRLQQVHAPWRQTKLQNTNSKCCSAVRRVISLGYNDGTTLIYERTCAP